MPDKRLSDPIISAHAKACVEGKDDIAALLIEALSLELTRIGGVAADRREETTRIEAAFTLHETTFGNLGIDNKRADL
ncbi:MAG: hypothetical protein COB59_02860 [Rhodospirillaceae bacterium]|nr:MAG: hypothetical protein COB59_02860 [Rhodospirillaceae bacterium]